MSGSAQQHINKDIVQNTKILVPKINILNDFDRLIKPLFNQVSSLILKNKNLKSTRNYLLPKLISGNVDVSDVDIDTSILDE
jgi:type I restriction enzyme S subunit